MCQYTGSTKSPALGRSGVHWQDLASIRKCDTVDSVQSQHLDARICNVNISLSPEMLNGNRLVFIMISTCLSESPSQGQARVMRHDETLWDNYYPVPSIKIHYNPNISQCWGSARVAIFGISCSGTCCNTRSSGHRLKLQHKQKHQPSCEKNDMPHSPSKIGFFHRNKHIINAINVSQVTVHVVSIGTIAMP